MPPTKQTAKACVGSWKDHKPSSRTEHALPNSNSGMNRQPNKHTSMSVLSFDITYHFSPDFFVYWIENRSNHRLALEHLESSGTKIMMWGPIVR